MNFTKINELISYGVSNSTLHIHIVPTDVKNMLNSEGLKQANLKLIEALETIKTRPEIKDDNIKTIFAVSPILRLGALQEMFKKLGFSVSQTKSEKFLQIFPNAKSVYQASLPKSMLLSPEYAERALTAMQGEINLQNEARNSIQSNSLFHDTSPSQLNQSRSLANTMQIAKIGNRGQLQ